MKKLAVVMAVMLLVVMVAVQAEAWRPNPKTNYYYFEIYQGGYLMDIGMFYNYGEEQDVSTLEINPQTKMIRFKASAGQEGWPPATITYFLFDGAVKVYEIEIPPGQSKPYHPNLPER